MTRRSVWRTLAISAVVLAWIPPLFPVAQATTGAWPQFGFGPKHTFFDPFEATLNPSNVAQLQERWSVRLGDGVSLEPMTGSAVSDATLYVGSGNLYGTLYALHAATGEIRWTVSTENVSNVTDPAVVRHVAYFASLDGNLY